MYDDNKYDVQCRICIQHSRTRVPLLHIILYVLKSYDGGSNYYIPPSENVVRIYYCVVHYDMRRYIARGTFVIISHNINYTMVIRKSGVRGTRASARSINIIRFKRIYLGGPRFHRLLHLQKRCTIRSGLSCTSLYIIISRLQSVLFFPTPIDGDDFVSYFISQLKLILHTAKLFEKVSIV